MRRRRQALAGLVVAAALLTACGRAGSDAELPATGPTTSSASTVTTTPPTSATAAPTTTTTTTSDPGPRVVVGLGDSVTAGTACGCTDFVNLYAAMLGARSGHPVRAVNLGVGGLTTSSLGAQLATPQATSTLSTADVVVVTIGANDLTPLIARWQGGGCGTACMERASQATGTGLSSALTRVRRAIPPHARILVTTYWNVFEDGDVADADFGPGFAAWSDAVTRSANAAIRAAASADGDEVVDLYAPFEGRGERNPTALLADDGDHPNAAGHQLIARTLLAATPA